MSYFNYPCDVAAALHALADELAALPPFERMPDLWVSVDIQVCQHDGTPAERIAAVDALAFAVLGLDASTMPLSNGSYHHRTPVESGARGDGLEVTVYTRVPAPDAVVAA
ncbi:hypothetical protein ABT297_11030 [Dactylosporangium sp. NPDC000555]|uniref:hypothetical protein n=1 Tax=Dactylosporangium sp. NPDC000555 TaxID=3154260 RepID=UPI0033309290